MFTNFDKFYYLSLYLVKQAKGKGGLIFVSGVDQRKQSAWSLKNSVVYPEKTVIERDAFIPMFITALFTVARTWQQPRCPRTDEWNTENVVHVYYGVFLSHKKECLSQF